MENELDSSKIFFQKQRYNGKLTLNNLAFNVYLQEFAAQVRHICNLPGLTQLAQLVLVHPLKFKIKHLLSIS
jgi:hypothetical protein